MAKFKIGDKVLKRLGSGICCSAVEGEQYIVQEDPKSSTGFGIGRNVKDLCHCQDEWELVEEVINLSSKTMNIKEKFALAFKSEPEKTFRKAGITNSDDFLTDDGQKIFLSYLLKEHGTKFKTEVVDQLLADEDDK